MGRIVIKPKGATIGYRINLAFGARALTLRLRLCFQRGRPVSAVPAGSDERCVALRFRYATLRFRSSSVIAHVS